MCCRNRLLISLCSLFMTCWTSVALSAVTLPAVIGDNMVLQRGQPVPIWGWADKGEEVTVTVAGQTLSTKAGDDGRWKVVLAKLDVGEPLEMTVKGSSGSSIMLKNILVGEVWVVLRPIEHGDGRRRCNNAPAGNRRGQLSENPPVYGVKHKAGRAADQVHRRLERVQPGLGTPASPRWLISSDVNCTRN